MLRLRETANQLAMANNDRWYGHLLRREESHALSSLDFEVEGQRKKGRPKSTWKKQAGEETVKVGLSRENALC